MGDSDLGGGDGVEFWRAEAERLATGLRVMQRPNRRAIGGLGGPTSDEQFMASAHRTEYRWVIPVAYDHWDWSGGTSSDVIEGGPTHDRAVARSSTRVTSERRSHENTS